MKEQWTKDLQQKMNGFEVPTIPEGLWENIDAALDSKTPVTTPTAKKVSLFPHWRRACAAILLLLAIPTAMYLLQTTPPNPDPFPVNGEGETTAHNILIKKNSERQEASPTLSIPSAKHIAKAIIPQTTTSETAIDNSSNPAIDEQVNKVEEVNQDSPINKQTEGKEKVSNQSATTKGAHEEPVSNYGKEDITFSKKKSENRLYLAMNASGTNFFSGDLAANHETMYYANDNNHNDNIGKCDPDKNDVGLNDSGYCEPSEQYSYHEETHHRPISIGLQVGIPVAKDWSVVTGLTYTYLHSEFTDGTGLVITHTDQKLHFVGIPVQMNYQLYNNRHCNVYLGAGGRADFGISGKTNHDSHLSHLPVNYSLKASAGVQVNLFKNLNIFAEPTLQYNIPGSIRYKTYYTEHKTMLDLQLGIRFTP